MWVLEKISREENGMTFMSLYRSLPMSKPCLAITLKELREEGYIKNSPAGLYHISEKGREFIDQRCSRLDIEFEGTIDYLIGKTEERIGQEITDRNKRLELRAFFFNKLIENVVLGSTLVDLSVHKEENNNLSQSD